jgi:DNA-binding transcriptional ArsR family regulator
MTRLSELLENSDGRHSRADGRLKPFQREVYGKVRDGCETRKDVFSALMDDGRSVGLTTSKQVLLDLADRGLLETTLEVSDSERVNGKVRHYYPATEADYRDLSALEKRVFVLIGEGYDNIFRLDRRADGVPRSGLRRAVERLADTGFVTVERRRFSRSHAGYAKREETTEDG